METAIVHCQGTEQPSIHVNVNDVNVNDANVKVDSADHHDPSRQVVMVVQIKGMPQTSLHSILFSLLSFSF